MTRALKRIICAMRGHQWQRSSINPISRRNAKTCRRCGKRVVWRWEEGTVVWQGPGMWHPGDEWHLPSTKAESVERWRAAERAAGRETR